MYSVRNGYNTNNAKQFKALIGAVTNCTLAHARITAALYASADVTPYAIIITTLAAISSK